MSGNCIGERTGAKLSCKLAYSREGIPKSAFMPTVVVILNEYQSGMCISGVLPTTERTPQLLISPLGPNWVATDSGV